MLKKLISIAVISLLLVSCGGGGSSSSAPTTSNDPDTELPGTGETGDSSLAITPETPFDPHWTPTGVFTNAASCGNCHKASSDGSGVMRLPRTAAGEDISPWALWGHSLKAQAWADPYFQAVVEDQSEEFPDFAGDIQDKCLSCHSPMAHSDAHDTGLGLSTAACPLNGECYTFESSQQQDHAREGVSCSLCHQMVSEESVEPGSGNYLVPAADEPDAWLIKGPFENPIVKPMAINTPYSVTHSDYLSSSEHCASCHELDTPAFDVNTGYPAEPAIKFREQATYSEWRNSNYAEGAAQERSCQGCHMASPDDYETAIALMPSGFPNPNWPQRSPFSTHANAGGNTYVLGLLKTWREELGIAGSTTEEGFDQAIAQGRAILAQAAAIAVTSQGIESGQLQLAVRITNNSGHKLPTGYPSRRMWLQLTVTDAAGKRVFESGKPDEQGYLAVDSRYTSPACVENAKRDDFVNEACFEPHRNQISGQDQVALFETVMADTNRHVTYSLLNGAGYLKDNRLPPAGFTSTSTEYDPASGTAGAALSDPDFNREQGVEGSGSDIVHYRIKLGDTAGGQFNIEARLWFQSIHPAFVATLAHRGEKTDNMRVMYREQSPQPELLAQDKLAISR